MVTDSRMLTEMEQMEQTKKIARGFEMDIDCLIVSKDRKRIKKCIKRRRYIFNEFIESQGLDADITRLERTALD